MTGYKKGRKRVTRAQRKGKKKGGTRPETSKPKARTATRRGGSVRVTTRVPGVDPGKVADRYDALLDRSCSARERRLIERAGVDITVSRRRDLDILAEYNGKGRDGRHQMILSVDGGKDSETMLHETVHILQEEDRRRPFFDRVTTRLSKKSDSINNMREALTEAETLSRESRTGPHPGYYKYLRGKDKHRMKNEDHMLLRSEGTVRSGAYAMDTLSRFDRTHISELGPTLGYRHTAAETKNDLMRRIYHKSEKKDGGRYRR